MFKTLFLCGREYSYQRNEVLYRALVRLGNVEIVNHGDHNSIILNSVHSILNIISKQNNYFGYDFLFIGFYGYLIALYIQKLIQIPIIFDAFISNYDTLCFDRKKIKPNSVFCRLAYWIDVTACKQSNTVLLDTKNHCIYFNKTFGIEMPKLVPIPVGCNEDIFYPSRHIHKSNTQTFDILYYSSFLPLHGVDIVLQAASLLRNEKQLRFIIIGSGPEHKKSLNFSKRLRLENIIFLPPMPIQQIAMELRKADICLGGHFGKSDKAQRVIPGKVYQILATSKPLIATNTRANRELLIHQFNAELCEPYDPVSLANSIMILAENYDYRNFLAENGRETFIDKGSEKIITTLLKGVIESILAGR